MSAPTGYDKPDDRLDAVRLHMNENTAGCSPAVLAALQRTARTTVSLYPGYAAATSAAARYLGVDAARVLLTNGLDEGILVTTALAFAHRDGAGKPEAIIALPTFDMYAIYVRALGGRLVAIAPRSDFEFPIDAVLGAVTADTRVVHVAHPNNPTGQPVPRDALRRLVGEMPSSVLILIDEAYYEFCGDTFLDEAAPYGNVLIGRTFAKAFGLAGLRVGCLIGAPETLARLRAVVPPYSVNTLAAAALVAALEDLDYLRWYQAQVAESKRRVYEACARLQLPCWKSGGNFVLIKLGERTRELVARLAARGIMIRDRSHIAGCEGCVRVGAGVVEHTDAFITALEEEWAGAAIPD
jgi:histidinol-phosphate aminotransferase